jgi:hypothetical protein
MGVRRTSEGGAAWGETWSGSRASVAPLEAADHLRDMEMNHSSRQRSVRPGARGGRVSGRRRDRADRLVGVAAADIGAAAPRRSRERHGSTSRGRRPVRHPGGRASETRAGSCLARFPPETRGGPRLPGRAGRLCAREDGTAGVPTAHRARSSHPEAASLSAPPSTLQFSAPFQRSSQSPFGAVDRLRAVHPEVVDAFLGGGAARARRVPIGSGVGDRPVSGRR